MLSPDGPVLLNSFDDVKHTDLNRTSQYNSKKLTLQLVGHIIKLFDVF